MLHVQSAQSVLVLTAPSFKFICKHPICRSTYGFSCPPFVRRVLEQPAELLDLEVTGRECLHFFWITLSWLSREYPRWWNVKSVFVFESLQTRIISSVKVATNVGLSYFWVWSHRMVLQMFGIRNLYQDKCRPFSNLPVHALASLMNLAQQQRILRQQEEREALQSY